MDFPSYKMVIFNSYVKLPEGKTMLKAMFSQDQAMDQEENLSAGVKEPKDPGRTCR